MSARDRLRQANTPLVEIKKPSSDSNTIISDVINNYDSHENKPTKDPEPPTVTPAKSDDKKGGRPVEFKGVRKQIKLQLPENDYDFLRDNCGRYGGMTKYLIYLVEEEMKRRRVDSNF